MPKVSVTRSWPDDDQIHVAIEVADDHPDGLLEEAARVAVKCYADAMGVTISADIMDDEDEAP